MLENRVNKVNISRLYYSLLYVKLACILFQNLYLDYLATYLVQYLFVEFTDRDPKQPKNQNSQSQLHETQHHP